MDGHGHGLEFVMKKESFPPLYVDLASSHVTEIVRSKITAKERADSWPSVFTLKGLRASYKNKGNKASTKDKEGIWRYECIFGGLQMHGDEGGREGRIGRVCDSMRDYY